MSWPYDPADRLSLGEEEHRLLRELIRSRIGLDFGPTRRDILASRLKRRLDALSLRSYLEYYRFLIYAKRDQREREFTELADQLANHETYFFRESYQFDILYQHLWSSVARTTGATRILSAGCSTGEEVYGLVMAAYELKPPAVVEVVGVDLCPTTVEQARQGIYRAHSFRAPLPFPRDRYFIQEGEILSRVRPEVKSSTSFAPANLLDTLQMEVFGPVDAIFCRNVLIYFDDTSLTRVARIFHRILRPGGYLFLGHSESFLGRGLPFEALRVGHNIVYRRID
jgi:chemotaxis protein methyltransferase CheR